MNILTNEYADPLKAHLLAEYDINAVVLFDPEDDALFDHALSTGVVLCLEATRDERATGTTRFISVEEYPGTDALLDAIQTEDAQLADWGTMTRHEQADLEATQNWHALFNPLDVDTSTLTPLSELATVSRGISTGENDFFILTQHEAIEAGLDEQYLSRLVRSAQLIDGYDFRMADWEQHRDDGNEVWLLYLDAIDAIPDRILDADTVQRDENTIAIDELPSVVSAEHGIERYLLRGLTEHDDLTERYVLQHRVPWYRVARRDPAPILLQSMSRDGAKAIFNEAEARHVNNLHGIYPADWFDTRDIKMLLAFLNSDVGAMIARQHARTYAGGLEKFEPGDIEDVPVVDPRAVTDDTVTALAEQFDALRTATHKDDEQVARQHINDILCETLKN